jgi:O-antigen/teichoic acid export membrane protein
MAFAMSLLCLVTYIVARPVIVFLYGSEFMEAAIIVRWMLPSVLALGVINIVSQYFAAAGFPWRVLTYWACGLIATLLTAALSLPEWGANGAALSLGIGHLVVLLMILPAALREKRAVQEH